MIPRVLIIAGSDSGGGAGIQADIKTVTMLGGHAMTAITAITAQNTLGVQAVLAVPTDMVIAQINSVVTDIGVDAVKIGMIGSAATAHAAADVLESLDVPIVFDPVMVATSGDVLADGETIAAFERLIRIATVTTPNLPEFEALARSHSVRPELVEGQLSSRDTERRASTSSARTESGKGAAMLVKGGHSEGAMLIDRLLIDGVEVRRWTNARIDTRHTHGTGCTLASGIAAGLACGLSLNDAIARAISFVRATLANAPGLGAGHGPMGHALGAVPFDVISEGKCRD
jgi:hydroxymethylpyrimidine/phosphomethylpyrimidine kinase